MLDFGHWSVRDYVPFRHQIFGPNSNGPLDTIIVLYQCSSLFSSMPPSLTSRLLSFCNLRFLIGSGWRYRCGGSVELLAPGYDDGHRFQYAGEACRRLPTGLRGKNHLLCIRYYNINTW